MTLVVYSVCRGNNTECGGQDIEYRKQFSCLKICAKASTLNTRGTGEFHSLLCNKEKKELPFADDQDILDTYS